MDEEVLARVRSESTQQEATVKESLALEGRVILIENFIVREICEPICKSFPYKLRHYL